MTGEPLATPLDARTRHLCVDMQNLFARDTAWHTPWMDRVLPRVVALTQAWPERAIYTRFIPGRGRAGGPGGPTTSAGLR